MKFLLRLKHWQLFLFMWGIPIVLDVISVADPIVMLQLFPLLIIICSFSFFGWLWAIATQLHKKLLPGIDINLSLFKVFFTIPVVYLVSITMVITGFAFETFFEGVSYSGSGFSGLFIACIVILHIASTVCILLALRLATKIFKSVELGRLAKFGDYAGEFFLIWFSPIGIWFIQPRLNGFVKRDDTTNERQPS